jgi:hypothetical protein
MSWVGLKEFRGGFFPPKKELLLLGPAAQREVETLLFLFPLAELEPAAAYFAARRTAIAAG